MVKLLNYCPSLLLLVSLSCSNHNTSYYKKEIGNERHKALAIKLTEGIHHYYQGTVAQQLLLLEALKYDTTNGDVYREKGVPYLKRGLAAGFYTHYRQAVKHSPVVWTGWRGYIYLFFYRDYERALADFNSLDKLTPDLVDYPQSLSVDYLRGLCYLLLEMPDSAIYYFDKHLVYEAELSGKQYIMPQAYLYKGIAHFKKEEHEMALETLQQGLDLTPNNADLLFWKAKCYGAVGKKSLADVYLNKAETSIRQGQRNIRPYVEEFYAVYASDVHHLRQAFQ